MFSPQQLLVYIISIPIALISLSVHECAHGFVSYKLGDPTARNLGRLTLNPLKHIDLIGLLCMVMFRIGWAKPVPVNARYYKNPRAGMALTAAAGPISNFILGFICVIAYMLIGIIPVSENSTMNTVISVFFMFFYSGAYLNITLAIFNLIPIPPFDGSRIVFIFLPTKLYFGIMKYERYIMLGVLVLLFLFSNLGVISAVSSAIIGGMEKLVGLIPGL